MAKCANCGANMSCGCQKRAASNGTSACSSCISGLESKLALAKQAATQIAQTAPAPQQWGANRYNKTN